VSQQSSQHAESIHLQAKRSIEGEPVEQPARRAKPSGASRASQHAEQFTFFQSDPDKKEDIMNSL